MRAIRVHEFGGPEVLLEQDCARPQPAEGQVVVRVEAAGVNPVDTYIRSGAYGQRPLPYTPGLDGSGVVEEVGPNCTWDVGQRVYLSGSLTGCYAQYALCRQDQVFPLPQALSFQQGACIFVAYFTAYRALFQRGRAPRGAENPRPWVLISGASGGVGLAAVQLALQANLRVIATASSPKAQELLTCWGVEHVLNHHQNDGPFIEAVRDITDGFGPELVLEMLANVNLCRDLQLIARYGRVVVIGSRGELQFAPRLAMSADADILGMSLFNTPDEQMAEIQAALQPLFEAGRLQPVVQRTYPLGQACQAHHDVLSGQSLGKLVLCPFV